MPRLSSAYQAVLRSLVDSDKINSVSWGAEALYVRLLLSADGAGRFFGEARTVFGKVAIRRASSSVPEIEGFLFELERAGLIVRWDKYLEIVGYFSGGATGEGKGRVRTVLFPPRPSPSILVPPCPPDRRSEIGDLDLDLDRRLEIGDRESEGKRASVPPRPSSSLFGAKEEPHPNPPKGGKRSKPRPQVDPKVLALELYPDVGNELLPAIDRWIEYRSERRLASWKESTWRAQLKEAAQNPKLWIEAVEQSIAMGYQGFKTAWVKAAQKPRQQSDHDLAMAQLDAIGRARSQELPDLSTSVAEFFREARVD